MQDILIGHIRGDRDTSSLLPHRKVTVFMIFFSLERKGYQFYDKKREDDRTMEINHMRGGCIRSCKISFSLLCLHVSSVPSGS